MKKVLLLLSIAIAGCQKPIDKPALSYLYLKVQKNVTIRYTYAINDFHVIVYSDSSFQHQIIPPSTIYIQADVDGSTENYELHNPDTRILASESLRIIRVLYADKNTIINF